MEKYYFNEAQPRLTVGDGVVLLLINGQEKTQIERPETFSSDLKDMWAVVERKVWVYDGVRLETGGMTSEAALTAAAQKMVLAEIDKHDTSSAVNGFMLNGQRVWLDKATRVGLMNSTTIAKAMGQPTTLWLGDVKLVVECDKAIQLLSALEMYALECFNVTAAHKKAMSEMSTVESVLEYDYTAGYPKMLEMRV